MATTHRSGRGPVVIVFRGGLGSLIRLARQARGWSGQQLAQSLYMDARNLQRIEAEVIGVELQTVVRAANLLRYPPLVKRAMARVQAEMEGLDHAA